MESEVAQLLRDVREGQARLESRMNRIVVAFIVGSIVWAVLVLIAIRNWTNVDFVRLIQ